MFALTIDHPISQGWFSPITQTIAQIELPSTVPSTVSMSREMVPPPYRYMPGNALTTTEQQNSIDALGWSKVEALETLLRLHTFADDWDHTGMEAYDDL